MVRKVIIIDPTILEGLVFLEVTHLVIHLVIFHKMALAITLGDFLVSLILVFLGEILEDFLLVAQEVDIQFIFLILIRDHILLY